MRAISLSSVALAAALTFMGAAPASASIIFDNGAPDQDEGFQAQSWVEADDFQLLNATTLTDGHFWTLELTEGTPWDGTLEWFLFADAGGQPAAAPFANGNGLNIVRTPTGVTVGFYDEYEYSFDLSAAVPLLGGTPYWFGLHLDADYDFAFSVFWETTASGFGSQSMNSLGGTFDNWQANIDPDDPVGGNTNLAFFLTDDLVAAVPEPGTLALFGVSLLGLAALRRRRKASSA
jgi:hypothetical protein